MPFSAQTRMSGIDLDGREIRKGAADAIARYVKGRGGEALPELQAIVDRIARAAARRWSSPNGRGRSASSTSRTSSRAACGERFDALRAWASGR